MSETKSISKSENWIKQLNNGFLKSKTIIVLDYISKNPNTNLHEMRNAVPHLSHQTITSRISNLMDEGIVKITGDVEINETPYSTYLFVSSTDEQLDLKRQRAEEKFLGWVKQGLNDHIVFLSKSMTNELKFRAKQSKIIEGDLSTL